MIAKYPDLTALWHKSAAKQLLAPLDKFQDPEGKVASIDTIFYDNLLACDSMSFDFDMGRDLWLTKSRFTVLQRDYLDPVELSQFLDRCESIGLGEAKRGVVTQMFAKQHGRKNKKYRWGNCMMAWVYRGGDRYQKPTLSMHSRVSYIAYIGGLDLALCNVLAREIGARIGLEPEDFSFRWYVDSLQFHGFKSLPYLFRLGFDPLLDEETSDYPSKEYPTLKLVRRWWKGMKADYENEVPLEDQRYGPLKRIRKRYGQYMDGPQMDSVPLEALSFEPLFR